MKYSIGLLFTLFLYHSSLTHAVLIDVDAAGVASPNPGRTDYSWFIPDTGITQLDPGGSYSLDIEFLDGQSFEGMIDVVALFFFVENGAAIVDPMLEIASGSVLFTGVTGDLDSANPTDQIASAFFPNLCRANEPPPCTPDAWVTVVAGGLTSDGFGFHDVHFDFTLQDTAQDQPHPVGAVYMLVQVINEVPAPTSLALFALGLAGLVLVRGRLASEVTAI